ncbi:E3 ubiquitin-protein ligase E3D isoform X2 [Passer domesticus]|uniref:E3 ubiquitin-protein ligase E3D isoform X2 n=1 Tax=Passer domesticus TaxID=48849 RepID=UPI0030FEF1B9
MGLFICPVFAELTEHSAGSNGKWVCLSARCLPSSPSTAQVAMEDVVFALRESLKPNNNYIFYCQSCGDIVVNDRKFLRVLPLPSENWSDLVEEWCCHPDPFARSTLHPQHGDCFVGDTFFLLNSRNESHVHESPVCSSEAGHHVLQSGSNLKSKENTRVICKRCKTMLGETVSSGTIKYYVTEVVVQSAEGGFSPTPRSQFVQSIVAQCLLELSSAKSTFRFAIKGDNGKTYILIWLLNSDTLLVESLGSSSSHSDFTLFGDILTPSSGPVGTWNALKVLYQPCIQGRNKEDCTVGAVLQWNENILWVIRVCSLKLMLLKLHGSQMEKGRQCRKEVGEHPRIFSLEKYVEHYFEITYSEAKLLLERIKMSRFIAMQEVAVCLGSFLCFRGITCL